MKRLLVISSISWSLVASDMNISWSKDSIRPETTEYLVTNKNYGDTAQSYLCMLQAITARLINAQNSGKLNEKITALADYESLRQKIVSSRLATDAKLFIWIFNMPSLVMRIQTQIDNDINNILHKFHTSFETYGNNIANNDLLNIFHLEKFKKLRDTDLIPKIEEWAEISLYLKQQKLPESQKKFFNYVDEQAYDIYMACLLYSKIQKNPQTSMYTNPL